MNPPRDGGSAIAIRSVFVANRGEIARRIARTCDRLGIACVVPDTEGPAALDLLDAEAVVAAAVAAGADAVHPGFGFLAENAAFAEAVVGAGLLWIGPPAGAIRAMGDKAAARRLAASLGVPVVDGYDGDDQDDGALSAAARRIGAPLLVKPAGGGGGKGMVVVHDLDRLPDALATARRQARAAFGDDRLVLERYLAGPRHVEIQVLFDAEGNGVHLGERDCSAQRRHQKVLEETPSPAFARPGEDRGEDRGAVGDEVRLQMGRAALTLAGAVGYVGAGTCEFLLEDGGRFHFLEMNTRLQVEHPVTELVTGRDLVADQIRIAAGDALGFGQADVSPTGHAIEVRLYAEDAEHGYLPATGRIERLCWPEGEGIRVDAGIDQGSEIGGRFDPMLAKVIAYGDDRDEALDRLRRALDETIVLGVVTNLRFLRWLVREPIVMAGDVRVDTLGAIWPPDDTTARTAIPGRAWEAAGRALSAGASEVDHAWGGGWRLNAPSTVRLLADGKERSVRLASIRLGSIRPRSIRPRAAGTADGSDVATIVVGDAAHVDIDGRSVAFTLAPPPDVDAAARAAAAHGHDGGPGELVAPMPGTVLAVHHGMGDRVSAGDPVVTLEAMKMEHVVATPVDGSLAEVTVRTGDQVARGQVVAIVVP